jgi:glycosyltransferase involved in cell wall biosynthesis
VKDRKIPGFWLLSPDPCLRASGSGFRARIAIFEPYYKFWGGAQISALELAKALRKRGYDVSFIFPERGIAVERIRKEGFPCLICKQGKAMDVFKDEVYKLSLSALFKVFLSLLFFNLRLALLLRREKLDVLILNTGRGTLIGGIAGRMAGIFTIANIRAELGDSRGWKEVVLKKFITFIPNHIVCVSKAMLDSLALPKSKPAMIMYNWMVKYDWIEPSHNKEKGKFSSEDRLLLGFVGNLEPHKGLHILLSALGKIKDELKNGKWQLLVAGAITNEEYFRSLQDIILRYNMVEMVRFLGWVDNIREFLSSLDIFILPSFTEGMPRSLMEAMCEGVAVVASDVGGIPELVGEAGILVPPGDVDAMAKALRYLSENDEERERLGKMGRERVLSIFTEEKQVGRLVKLIEGARARRQKPEPRSQETEAGNPGSGVRSPKPGGGKINEE